MTGQSVIDGCIACLENSIAVQKRVIERRENGRMWTMANDRNAGVAALAHDRRILDSSTRNLKLLQADRSEQRSGRQATASMTQLSV